MFTDVLPLEQIGWGRWTRFYSLCSSASPRREISSRAS